MTIKYINNWSSELLEPMPAANKTLPVSADKLLLLEDVTPDSEYRITLTDGTNYEVISVSRDNYAAPLSVSRGVDNTAPRSWPATTKVFAGLTAGMLSELRNLSQSVRNVSGAMTVIDVNEAGKWVCLLEGDTSISLSTAHTGAQASVLLMQDDAGGHAVSWPDLIDWAGSNKHGRIGGQVTKIDLVKIGPDRWGASSTVYPVPLGALYAFAWQGQDNKVLLSIADESQSVLFSVGMPTDMTEDINDSWVWLSVSPDSRFVLFCDGYDTPVRLYSTLNWSFIEIDAPFSQRRPVKIPPQIRGDWVYGYNEDAGVYRASVATGERENTGIVLDGYPQSLSCSDGEITLTFNMTTSGVAVMSSPILTYDINTFTLIADQFSYPDGAGKSWIDDGPPSPFGISGRYSVDGSMYALSASMTYGPTYSERGELFIYDSSTKQIIQTHAFSVEHDADQYFPTWSENGKYCAVVSENNYAWTSENQRILVVDVEANTSIEIDLSPYGDQSKQLEIMLTNDGFIIATINSATSPKPFVTFSAVTGLEAPDWGGSVYGSDAGQLGLIIGSNQ